MRSILGRVMANVSPGTLALPLIALIALALGSCEEYPTDIAGIEPPSITGVQMTPDSANVTSDDVEVEISVGARGSGGVDSVGVVFVGPNDDDALSCVAYQPVAGDRSNGDWACDILLAAGSAPGLWRISGVELHHGGGEVLRLSADDLQEAGYAIDILVLAYRPPLVRIEAPADGASFMVGDTVHFEGWASMRIDDGGTETGVADDTSGSDQVLTDSALVWTSDLDGQLGIGEEFATAALSEGTHLITLTATDERGVEGSARITVEIVEAAPEPELLLTAIFPEVFDLEWLGGGWFDGPEGIVLAVVPDPNSPAPDTIDAVLTGPTGQSFTCEVAMRVDPAEVTDLFPDISMDSQPWGCILTFGIPFDPDGPSPIDPEELAAALDTVELGTWRITEIGMTRAGNWYTYDEAALDTAGHELSVEVIRTEPIPGVHAISVTPWRATIPGLGSTTQLTATAVDDTWENPVPGVTFTWTSLDPHIATVDENGLVTGHSPGTARITASAGVITSNESQVYVFEVGPPIAWDTIVAGPWHSCGLAKGLAYCWGNNEDGQLGTGDTENRFVPTLVAGGHTFTTLALGENFTVALDANGKAYAWGANDQGQLGDGTTIERITPTQVAGGYTFTAISAGNAHVVALTEKGTVLTWGSNANGQLGDNGAPRDNLVPAPVLGSHILGEFFTAVSAGYEFTMALRADSTLHTWGANSYGQLGHGDRTLSRNSPQPVVDQDTQLPMKFTSIDAGDYHAVAIDPNGQGWSWGNGSFGRLGNGSSANSYSPSRVSGGIKFAWIGAGGLHTLAIGADGAVWGWGEGLQGQLGNGTKDRYDVPTMIAQIQGFVLLSPGSVHTIGLDAMGMAYAWGWASNGMLGDGGLEDQATPVPVLGPVQ